jgi:hypothetical protein
MTTAAIRRAPWGDAFFRILMILTLAFFALLGYATNITHRNVQEVPLKPCKQCTPGCPCPRLSGSIRCGCAQ